MAFAVNLKWLAVAKNFDVQNFNHAKHNTVPRKLANFRIQYFKLRSLLS